MGVLIVLFTVMMMIGYAVNPNEPLPNNDEALLLLLFPVGMCVGYLLAWKWQLLGGVVSIACMTTFLIALHEADMVLTMAFLSIPGVLFIVYGMLSRGVGPGGSRD